MPNVDLEITALFVDVEPGTLRQLNVTILKAPLDEIVQQIGIDVLLDEIGKEKCVEHFGLEE